MQLLRRSVACLAIGLGLTAAAAQAGPCWSVGVRIGWPGCYRPWYGPYYYPGPVYVVPAPAVVLAPTVAVPPAAVVVPAYSSPVPQDVPPPVDPSAGPPPPPPETSHDVPTLPQPRTLPDTRLQPVPDGHIQPVSDTQRRATVTGYLHSLASPDERVRMEGVTQLGRMRARRAVDPLAATLAADRSPAVRDAAARALGLIGVPGALPALIRAAQMDPDHDVRHSAQFAAEIIQTRLSQH